jgi:hypothetical protein
MLIIIEYQNFNNYLLIIKGINLYYIFILNNIFEFKSQSWLVDFIDSIEFATNFRSLQLFEFDTT